MEVSGLKFFCKLYNQMKVRGGFDAVRTLVIWGIRDWADCAFKVSLDKGHISVTLFLSTKYIYRVSFMF